MQDTNSLINHDSQSLIANACDGHTKPSEPPVFILRDRSQYFILIDFLSMASAAAIISAISDERALSLFRAIAVSENYDNTNLLKNLRLTCKQYYAIRKILIDTGLIEQKNGRYQLTLIGEVAFSAQSKIEIAIENYWKLEALDSIMMSATSDESHLPAKEYQILVDKLIDNDQIKSILVQTSFHFSSK